MKSVFEFLKTTILGGVLFLIPIVILIIILGKAVQLMRHVAAPLDDLIPLDSVAGVAMANIIAIAGLIVLCFLAGVIAKSRRARIAIEVLEKKILWKVPGYSFFKGIAGGLMEKDGDAPLTTVLLRYDDSCQLGFEIERMEDGRVIVYVPGSPDVFSGGVVVIDAERVDPLKVSVPKALRILTELGRGSTEILSG